ncbi:host specificity protein J [Enterobacter phage ST22]|nr:host specificity protein J [Enterobacter phage ST22]
MEITEWFIPEGAKGGGGNAHTPVESPDSLRSSAKMRMLIALSEGVVQGGLDGKKIFLNGTPLQAQDGTMNFPGVRWEFRNGTATQDPIKGFPAVERPGTVGIDLVKATPWVHEITDTNLDAFRVRMGFPYMAKTESDGDTVGTSVTYTIELSTDGGAYKLLSTMKATGKTTSLYERDHRIDLPKATTKWSVRVTRVTADSTAQTLQNKTQIQGYTEVIDARMRYPHTALLYVEYDAKTFPQVPRVSCLLQGRQIQVPSNYDPVARTYTGDWDGTFKWAFTDNPAWVFYDIATNDRFSIGRKVKANMISKWDLYVIAQRCDELVPNGDGGTGKEPRFTCNVYIQGQEQAFNVLRDIASIFNGATFWGNSQLNVISDMPGDVKQVVTRANVVDGKFNYVGGSQKNHYSSALVSIGDKTNHYQDLPVLVSVPRLQKRYGFQQTQTSAIGCTSVGEGQRRGKYILLSNELDRGVSFKMGLDGIQFLPGHIIALADERLAGKVMGGRIKSVSADLRTVTLDRVTDAAIGDAILVRTKDGKPERRTIATVNGAIIGLQTALSAAPVPYAVFVIDAGTLHLQTFKVQSMKRSDGEDCYEITAIIHNASKYDAIDKGARLDIPTVSLLPVPGIKAPGNIAISAYDVIRQGQRVKTMRITWGKVQGALAYEIQWRKGDGDWVNGPRQSTTSYEVAGIYAGDYYARVRAIGASEVSSPWAESAMVTLPGRTGAPQPPIMGAAVKMQYGIQWNWTFAAGSGDTASTELQYQALNLPTDPVTANWLPLTLVAYPTGKYQQMGLAIGQNIAVRARCIDKLGNQSAWTAPVKGAANEVISDYIRDLDAEIQKSQAFKDVTTYIDTNLEKVGNDMTALGARVDTVTKNVSDLTGTVQTISGTVTQQGKTITTMQQTVQTAQQTADAAKSAAESAASAAAGGAKVYFQNSPPPSADQKANVLWIDTTNNANTPKRWVNNAWTAVTDKQATDAAAAAKTAHDTAVEAQKVAGVANVKGNNLFPDGSFESYQTESDLDLMINSGRAQASLVTSGAYAGTRTLRYNTNTGNADLEWLKQTQVGFESKYWYVSYVAKIGSGSAPAGCSLRIGIACYDGAGTRLSVSAVEANASNGLTTAWKTFSGYVLLPEGTRSIRPYFYAPHGTTAWPAGTNFWIDAVCMYEADAAKRAADLAATVQVTANAARDKLGKYDATWTVKAQVDSAGRHYMAGISAGVSWSEAGGGSYQGTVLINANNFAVYVPGANNGNGVLKNMMTVNAAGVWMNLAMIQDATITNAKIANATIQGAKIASAAISSAHIVDGAITNAKIAKAAIDSAKIANASINTAHLGTVSIKSAQIESLHANKITGDIATAYTVAPAQTLTIPADSTLNREIILMPIHIHFRLSSTTSASGSVSATITVQGEAAHSVLASADNKVILSAVNSSVVSLPAGKSATIRFDNAAKSTASGYSTQGIFLVAKAR